MATKSLKDYTMYNANNVLQKLEKLIYNGRTVGIRDVYDELNRIYGEDFIKYE